VKTTSYRIGSQSSIVNRFCVAPKLHVSKLEEASSSKGETPVLWFKDVSWKLSSQLANKTKSRLRSQERPQFRDVKLQPNFDR
jgi:hypothetical protein